MSTSRRAVELFLHETAARQQIALQSDRTNTIRLRAGRPVQLLELPAAAAFHPESPVPLPVAPDGGPLSLLGALATALDAVEREPELTLLVAAHHPADDEGELTRRRARAVTACLQGDGEAFAAACARGARVRDWQRVLQWVAAERGWACDPGAVDDVSGPRSQEALRAFRAQHAASGGAPLPDTTAPGGDDWAAFLACYDQALADLLQVDPPALTSLRARLQLVHHPLGCGGAWPLDRVRIGRYTGTSDERVDLLLFEEADAPQLRCHPDPDAPCDWKRCDVYRKKKYVQADLAFAGPAGDASGLLEVQVVNASGRPLANLPGELILPDATRRPVVTDPEGWIRHLIAPHTTAQLSFAETGLAGAAPQPAAPPSEPPQVTLSRARAATDPLPAELELDAVLEVFAHPDPLDTPGAFEWTVQGAAVALAAGEGPRGEQAFLVGVEPGVAVVVATFTSGPHVAEARHTIEVTAFEEEGPQEAPGLRGPALHADAHPDEGHTCDPPLRITDPSYGELEVHPSCRGQVALWVYDEEGAAAATPARAGVVPADGFVFDGVTWKVNGNTRVTAFVAGGQLRLHTCAGTLAELRGATRPTVQPEWVFGTHRMPPRGALPELTA